VIELDGITRDYEVGGRPVHALRGIDLTIEDGEYVAVMGPSGSGKSTLLNILGCLDRATSGSYLLDGHDVSGLSDATLSQLRAHRIGFVFQTFHLVPRLTAAGNVELPMIFAGIEPHARTQRVNDALARVGLSARADHRPDQLSGGERQRVALARAIVMGPSILLADEPTGNLDRASGREIVALLEALNTHGLTLIVVTHDPELGQRAGRLIRLVDGALASDERAAAQPAEPPMAATRQQVAEMSHARR
jgi:putative ABC transport system ATP-binding protein